MFPRPHVRLALVALLLEIGWLASPAPAPAQPAAQPEPPPATSAAPAPNPPADVAHFVFIPFDRAADPRLDLESAVLLPYAEFLRLKGSAGVRPGAPDFPASAALSAAQYIGRVEEGVARFEVELTLEVLGRPEQPLAVQLPFPDAAIESVAAAENDVSFSPLPQGSGLAVALRGEGTRAIRLRLAVPLRAEGANQRLRFAVPRAAAAKLTLDVPREVELLGEETGLPATLVRAEGGGSRIEVSAGGGEVIELAYRPKAEATGAAAQARLAVDQDYTLEVGGDGGNARVALRFELLAGRLAAVPVQLPAGARLLGISGSFVRDWSAPDPQGVVTVELVREVHEPFDLTLNAQLADPPTTATLEVPPFRVPGAARETGTITVVPAAGLSVWPETSDGLEPADAGESGPGARAFRFAQPGWRLTLSRRSISARVRADNLVLYEVTEGFVRLKSRHRLDISGRGIFEIGFRAPEGFSLKEAGPPDLIAGFRQQGSQVRVNLRGEQLQPFAVELSLERARPAAEREILLEPIAVIGADEDAGNLVLAAPLALRATETRATGLEAADARRLGESLSSLLAADLVPVLGYRYYTPMVEVVAAIERQLTRLTCDTALLASINPALMRIDATLNYNVEFSATDSFQLLLPASAGEEVRFSGADIKEKTRAAGATPDGLTTWTVRLQRRVLGAYPLGVSFDVGLTEAAAGATMNVGVPMVQATGVARQTATLAVARGENLEVGVANSESLEPRDVKELPAQLAGGFLGFRTFDPRGAALELKLVRHELSPVLGALVRRLHIQTVLSEQREAVHEAIFEVQNNREQYLELQLPAGMEIWSAFVRGAPVRTTTRADGTRLIELTKSEQMDTAFRVRLILRQTLKGGKLGAFGGLRFEPPTPRNIEVLRTTWKLYLPDGYRYIRFAGSMRQESGGRPPWIEPAAEKLINDLPAEIAGGIAQPTLHPPRATVPVAYDAGESEAEKQLRLQGSALEIPIIPEGRQFEFSKLSGVGDIKVSYWRGKPLLLLQAAFGLLVFIGLLFAMARYRRLGIGVAALVASFILASLTAGLWGRLSATALAASAAALLLGLLIAVLRRSRGHAASSAPDFPTVE